NSGTQRMLHFPTAKFAVVREGPLLKTVRYYNTTPTDEQLNFPSFFACGNFSTKLQVFNKGNLPAYNFRINETKIDIIKTHPGDLIFYGFNPSNPYLEQSKLISWDGGINFIATGKDNAINFTYSIFVPYQTNGTFSFQALALNNTFSFFDEEYIISISCGASLSIDQIRIRKGEYPEPTIYVNDIFNISANIYNDGPGNASNVIVWINYTNVTQIRGLENLKIYNSNGEESNTIYLGNILPKETKIAFNDYYFTVNTSGVSPGIITFCINANATENSTIVSSCRDITINAPPALIELENPIAISKETGSSFGSWSFNFTFNISVRVSNSENDVQICAWFSKTGMEPFKLIGCDIYPAPGNNIGSWRNYSFEYSPSCEDIGNPVFIKFNATNFAGSSNSTTLPFTITKSKIVFDEILGNNTETRRGKMPTILSVRVKDINGTYISNLPLRFYVTLNEIVFDAGNTVYTNESGYANYNFLAVCTPKYLVGYQRWKAELKDNECYFDNSTENYFDLRVLVTGDILPYIVRPDGSTNYTQEDTITLLGYVTDDCGDPLTASVIFFANHSIESFECSDVIQVGSNAYTCDWHTEITTPMGWYNVSMYVEKEFHYSNWSIKAKDPGLFYLEPIYKLEDPQAYPIREGWGYKNWNFSVFASSGDSENEFDVNIYLGDLWPPAKPCEECINITPKTCFNCYKQLVVFLRNFTAYEIGTWYYRFSLGPTSTTQVKYVIVEKDDTTMEYVSGNNSIVIRNSQPALLSVRVFDLDANTYELNPPALVTFKLYDERYPNGYKVIGSVYTNSSGYANLLLNITECTGWLEGIQKWSAEIDDNDNYYKKSSIGNFTIEIQLPGCQPQVDIYSIELPKEAFQYKNFTIVTYVTSWVGDSEDVYINITLPDGWYTDEQTKYLGKIYANEFKKIYWNVYASTFGEGKAIFYINSSNAGYKRLESNNIVVYKFSQSTINSIININSNDFEILEFDCETGNYRIANLTIKISENSNNSTLKIESFNSSNWIKIENNLEVISNNLYFIPILANQISSNSDGKCLVKITNVGDKNVIIESATLTSYYNETLKIDGIKVLVNNFEVESIDKTESSFNISVRIGNSLNINKDGNLTLKILKDGKEIYSNYKEFTINANSFTFINFTDIQTSNWEEGIYEIIAILNSSNEIKLLKREIVFSEIKIDITSPKYQCNSSTEKIYLEIYQPLEDYISYNISLQIPNSWNYNPKYIYLEPKGKGFYFAEFNLTAFSNIEEDYQIIIVINYTYANNTKSLIKPINIKVSPNIPILEIIRELPSLVSTSIVFKPRIVIHNKGCGIANNVTIKEYISAGWIGANPSIAKNEYANDPEVSDKDVDLIYSETDLINNILTWQLSDIKPNKYAVLTYQIKAPPTLFTAGYLKYNVSWNNEYYIEEKIPSKVYTYRYPEESHLEFDLIAIQTLEYPWPEVRSIQVNREYNFTLKVTNIGDINTNNDWTIKLYIPKGCEVINVENGIWNESERKIVWSLPNISTYQTSYFNFTLKCNEEKQYVLIAEGIRDTRSKVSFENSTSIYCESYSKPAYCYSKLDYILAKPTNARYEKLSNITIEFLNKYSGNNLTIGNSYIKIFDDLLNEHIIWQDYSFEEKNEIKTKQLIIYENQENFVSNIKTFEISSYSDATENTYTNISILKIYYTWDLGKLFNETQNLFIKSKVYDYTPLFRNAKLYINGNDSIKVGGWGEKFEFSVEVRDRFGRDVIVRMYHRKVGGEWSLVDEKVCYSCLEWTQFNFSYDYDYTDISNWEFKFEGINSDGISEYYGFVYTVEKDDVELTPIQPQWNETVLRAYGYNFTIYAFDIDNKTIPYVLEDYKAFVALGQYGNNLTYKIYTLSPSINESGYIILKVTNAEFCNPANNYYLGQNYWFGGIQGSAYYKDVNTRIPPYNALPYVLIGSLYNNIIYPINVNFSFELDTITLKGVVYDDCGNIRADEDMHVYFNLTNGDYNYQCIATRVGNEFQCTFNPRSLNAPLGWYNISMYSSKPLHTDGIYSVNNAFFLASIPKIINISINPFGGPWGLSPFNFSAYIIDEDGNFVNITHYLRKVPEQYFVAYIDNCTNCNYYLTSFLRNFVCDYENIEVGEWRYKIETKDEAGFSNTSQEISFTIEKEPINISLFESVPLINRSNVPNSKAYNLSVTIFDTILNRNVTEIPFVYLKLEGPATFTYEMEKDETQEKYYYEFLPGCSYPVGEYKWYSYVLNDYCYQNARSENYTINIYGSLSVNIISPTDYQLIPEGQSVTIRSNIIDDCGVSITNANVYYILRNERTQEEFRCPERGFANYDGTSYVCNFNTSGKPGGNYTIIAYASRNYYWDSLAIKENAFFLVTPVRIINVTMNYEHDGSWGEIHNFTALIDHYNDVIVCLLEKPIDAQEYQVTECKYVENPSGGKEVTFSRRYSCADFVKNMFWNYKINATEPGVSSSYSESQEYQHMLQKNDLSLIIYYNDSEAKRYGDQRARLIVYAYDLDQKQAAYVSAYNSPNIKFNVYNGSSFVFVGANSTNSSGYSTLFFKPDCSFDVGIKEWYAYTEADACYKNVISDRSNITVVGLLNPYLVSPINEEYTRYAELYINLSAIVKDECNLITFENATVTFIAKSVAFGSEYLCSDVAYSNGYYNCSLNATLIEEGWYNVNVTASNVLYYDDYYYLQTNSFKIIHSLVPPVLSNEYAYPEQDGGWGERWYFRVNVSDLNGDDVNIYLWISRDGSNWELVNQTICYNCGYERTIELSYKGFTCEDYLNQPIYFKFNATDAYNSTDRNPIALYLDKNDLRIEYYSGNESKIIRNVGGILQARIYDLDFGDYADSQVALYVTTDRNNYKLVAINNSLNSIATLFFNPTCEFDVGLQYWKIGSYNDACYKNVNSSDFNLYVIGNIDANITYPKGDKFLRGSNVTLNISIFDECSQSIPLENAKINITMISNRDKSIRYCTEIIELGNGLYSCTFNSSNFTPNYYNVTLNISKELYTNKTKTFSNVFWIETNPILFNLRAIPNVLGWGETLTIKVNFTDEDLDTHTINVYLIKSDYSRVRTRNILNVQGINVEAYTQFTFTSADIGDWFVIVNVTDDFGIAEINTSITIEKDDTIIEYISGNNSIVHRIHNTTTFELRAIDIDNPSNNIYYQPAGFWVTSDYVNYIYIGTVYTGNNGYFNITFDPDCRFETGIQKWKGGLLENPNWKASNSSEYFVIIVSNLSGNIIQPNGNILLRGADSLNIRATVSDECKYVNGADVYFVVGNENINITCDNVINDNLGNYTCSLSSSTLEILPYGWNNITMFARKDFYENELVITKQNAFYLADKPKIEDAYVTSATWRWGTVFEFVGKLYDLDPDNKTVYLWISRDGINWRLINQTTYYGPTPPGGVDIKLSFIPTCNDVGNWYFKFNVTDTSGYSSETFGYQFEILKRPAVISAISGLNEIIQREGSVSTTLRIKAIDAIDGANINNAKIKFITINKTGHEVTYETWTNQYGIASYIFDPDCSYGANKTYWKAILYDNLCYEDTVSPNFDIYIYGKLYNNLVAPSQGSTFPSRTTFNISYYITSDCSDEGLIENANAEIKVYDPLNQEIICTPIIEENGYYNCTFDTTGKRAGVYSITLNSTKQYYFGSYTNYPNWFSIYNSPPTYSNISVSPSTAPWTSILNFSVYVSDADNDVVRCSLEIKKGYSYIEVATMEINGNGLCSFLISDFSCDDIGTNYFRFSLSDGYNDIVYTEEQSFELTKSPVALNLISGNGTSVRRNIASTNLRISVFDLVKNSLVGTSILPEAYVKFNITFDSLNYINLDEVSTTSGYAEVMFSPDCSFSAGTQYWYAYISENDVCYEFNQTNNFKVYVIGSLNPSIIEPTNLFKVYKGNNVSIRANIQDDCNENISVDFIQINPISRITGQMFNCIVSEENIGIYNCSFETVDKPAGAYDIRVNVSKQYHVSAIYTESNAFFVETYPSLTNPSVTPIVEGWGKTRTFSITASDEDRDALYVCLYYRPKGSEDWILASCRTKPSGIASQTLTFSRTFSCDNLLGQESIEYEFFFNVTDDDNNIAESEIKNFILERDDISVSLAESYVEYNRSSTEKASLIISIRDLDANSYATRAVNATLYVTRIPGTTNYFIDNVYINRNPVLGNITFYFPQQNKCLYKVGPQKWYVSINSSCYKPANSPIGTLNITSLPLNSTLIYPIGEYFPQGYNIPITVEVYDDCEKVDGASLSIEVINPNNETIECYPVSNLGNGSYRCSFSDTYVLGSYTIKIQANKQYYPEGYINEFPNAFFITSAPFIDSTEVYASRTSSEEGGWGDTWFFKIRVYDEDQSFIEFEKLNISLYIDFGNGYEYISSQICEAPECASLKEFVFTHTFDCSKIGDNKKFKFIVRDFFNNTVESAEGYFNILPDEPQITILRKPTRVNREGNFADMFNISVIDVDRGVPANATLTLFITTDSSNFNFYVNLNSVNGIATYSFDPDCRFSAGIQYFKVSTNDSCYKLKTSDIDEFKIIGSLQNYIIYPYRNSDILIEFGKIENITLNVKDECENDIENANVNLNAIWPNNYIENIPVYEENSGIYNATWNLSRKIGG
ncbi:MAG: hypothetical protein QXX12_01505, partial [Nanopusillaceae archaeon]